MADPLAGLSQSPEAQIAQAFFAILKADTLLASAFKPILLIESPTREAFNELTIYTMAVVPFRVKQIDLPTGWSRLFLDLIVSAYLAKEPTETTSLLRGLDLGSHIRKIAYSDSAPGGGGVIPKSSAVAFLQLPTLEPKDTGVRILSCQVTFQTEIMPATGAFL